jgi:pyridoxal phosphate-dependent aminotransferase EpsN
VWTSTLTFAATANAIRYVGGTPVFIDSERDSWNIDPELLAEALAERAATGTLPKAVIVVDLYGQCADYDRILRTCEEYAVPVLEDAAEALGAKYRDEPAGSFGALSVFSFNGNKIITTSGGGALLSNDPEQIARARYLASQARMPAAHYEHEEVGYNYRLSNLLAALGRAQLSRLDALIARRRKVNCRYRAAFEDVEGVTFLREAPWGTSNHWLTCVLLDEEKLGVGPDAIREHLAEKNIEARPVWKPMHLQPAYDACQIRGGKVAEELFRCGLCLPSGSSLSAGAQQRVIDAVFERLGSRRD